MIKEKLLIAFVAFLSTFLLTPLVIKFSIKHNLVDEPHERGIHKKATPLAGGLAIAIPIILLQFALFFIFPGSNRYFLQLACGGTAIAILGYLDDKKKFTANHKLIFQILIISLVYLSGLKMELLTNPFGSSINLGYFSYPFTVIWFLLVINAFNLIDGLDGLATGISIILNAVLLAVGLKKANDVVIFLSLMLLMTNLAFLKYNFYPAKIFMGDTGSLFIGFNIAAISAAGVTQYKGITAMTLLVPLVALIVPISDTITTIFRRVKSRKHIFDADKEHLHHKMLDSGYSQKKIAYIGYFITFIFGVFAFGLSFANKEIRFAILLILIISLGGLFYLIFKKEFFK